MGQAAKRELQTWESAHAKAAACLTLDQTAECHRSLISSFETGSRLELHTTKRLHHQGWSRKKPEHEAVLERFHAEGNRSISRDELIEALNLLLDPDD